VRLSWRTPRCHALQKSLDLSLSGRVPNQTPNNRLTRPPPLMTTVSTKADSLQTVAVLLVVVTVVVLVVAAAADGVVAVADGVVDDASAV